MYGVGALGKRGGLHNHDQASAAASYGAGSLSNCEGFAQP